jgi:hypothetical protein
MSIGSICNGADYARSRRPAVMRDAEGTGTFNDGRNQADRNSQAHAAFRKCAWRPE